MGGTLTMLVWIWGISVTVVWIVIGWRAMRAHERVADSLERLAQKDFFAGNKEKPGEP